MKPYRHARNSVKKFGGSPDDYVELHNFMDISKSAHADVRHRAVLHNALGCFIAERVFGQPLEMLDRLAEKFNWGDEEKAAIMMLLKEAKTERATSMLNSDGTRVQVRDVAEEHIIEDLGRIPSLGDWLNNMTMQTWFGGQSKRDRQNKGTRHVPFLNED